jgi:hypothetical protein
MMQSVISSSISNARTSGSVDEVPPRKTASTPGMTQKLHAHQPYDTDHIQIAKPRSQSALRKH